MRALLTMVLLFAAAPAAAAELVVQVRTSSGAPVSNAVVTIYPGGRPAPLGTARMRYQIAQRDLQFSPFVLVVPVGSEVAFPNFDNVRHHVYSFSPVKRFDLRLFAREQNRSVRFDRPGAVPIGCNIHDRMTAFVMVVDTSLAAKTGDPGQVTLADVPAGTAVMRIWHPYLRAPGNQIQLRVPIPPAGRRVQPVTVALRPPPRVSSHY